MEGPVIMLCSECFSTTVLYNYINKTYPVEHIIIEQPLRGWALAKRRFKKLGFFKVTGQILFSIVITPLLRITSKGKVEKSKRNYPFDETPLPDAKKKYVDTVNDTACIELLKNLKPSIVLVNGTRIIAKKVLDATNAVFINMHAGITPRYRGVHGGYWALVNNDKENCGVTVHLVDKGIDTGNILAQAIIDTSKHDNFITYPYHQFGMGLPLVMNAVSDIKKNNLQTQSARMTDSRLWYHPTIGQYLYHRLFRKKK